MVPKLLLISTPPPLLIHPPTYRPMYSQLLPCGHPAITDTLIIETAAKSQVK